MPATPHIERHFTATEMVRDIVITAGLAEIAPRSIAMGMGGYLAARTDVEHHEPERQCEVDKPSRCPI